MSLASGSVSDVGWPKIGFDLALFHLLSVGGVLFELHPQQGNYKAVQSRIGEWMDKGDRGQSHADLII